MCLSPTVRWNNSLYASWTSPQYKNVRKCLQIYILVQIWCSVSVHTNLQLFGFCFTWYCHSMIKCLSCNMNGRFFSFSISSFLRHSHFLKQLLLHNVSLISHCLTFICTYACVRCASVNREWDFALQFQKEKFVQCLKYKIVPKQVFWSSNGILNW